jgi:hypothetical protein
VTVLLKNGGLIDALVEIPAALAMPMPLRSQARLSDFVMRQRWHGPPASCPPASTIANARVIKCADGYELKPDLNT